MVTAGPLRPSLLLYSLVNPTLVSTHRPYNCYGVGGQHEKRIGNGDIVPRGKQQDRIGRNGKRMFAPPQVTVDLDSAPLHCEPSLGFVEDDARIARLPIV